MGSLLRCLVRICCDTDDDDTNGRNNNRRIAAITSSPQSSLSPLPPVMVRALMTRDNLLSSGNNNNNNSNVASSPPSSSPPAAADDELHSCYQRAGSFPETDLGRQQEEATAATAAANTRRSDRYRLRHHSGNSHDDEEDDDNDDEHDTDDDEICCQFHNNKQQKKQQHPDVGRIFEFFRQVQERWHNKRYYDSLEQHTDTTTASTEDDITNSTNNNHNSNHNSNNPVGGSPLFPHNKQTDCQDGEKKLPPVRPPSPYLRTAITFDASRGIPTIKPDEVVLPGSLLQQQMAESMMSSLMSLGAAATASATDCNKYQHQHHPYQDECVICMEPFEETNPRMPTLCGCGENKAYFHLPCLYQWMEQSLDCPSCRQRLTWQEF